MNPDDEALGNKGLSSLPLAETAENRRAKGQILNLEFAEVTRKSAKPQPVTRQTAALRWEGGLYLFFCTSQSATSPSSTSSQPLNMAVIWLVRVWPVVVM